MLTFSEFVKHKSEEQGYSIASLQDMLGWPYSKSRAIIIGRLHPKQTSFDEAAQLALVLDVPIGELADAANLSRLEKEPSNGT